MQPSFHQTSKDNPADCSLDDEVFLYPASFAQQRLWFLDQFMPDTPLYNIAGAVQLSGHLNILALEQSLGEIIQRHETLRTTFVEHKGVPVQIIAPTLRVPLTVIDICQSDAPKDQLLTLIHELAQYPFDLGRGPLLRATLLQSDKQEHTFVIVMHHIISDGWSIEIFIREFASLYNAFLSGYLSPLPDLPIQYADYTVWQRDYLQGETLEKLTAYWKQQLAQVPGALTLTTDFPRPPIQAFQGASHTFTLPQPLAESLKVLCQEEGITLFMLLLTAFQVLLFRYTGQEDILVGSPVADRTLSEIEGLIGFFANMLVFRADLSENPTFRELLGRGRRVALEAYEHQDLPFEKLVEIMQPERDPSRHPLFQAMFALQSAPLAELQLSGLTLHPVEVDTHTAKFDLSLFITQKERQLTGVIEYNTSLFKAETAVRMQRHYQQLLESIVANPNRHLMDITLLGKAERQQLLNEWNATTVDYPLPACIHEIFEEQAARSPEAIALVCGDEQVSYGELEQRANQLAHYLQRRGVGPEMLVGICMSRSIDLVVALMAVLKAGGAYVPFDPTYPVQRLHYLLEDSQASLVLTQRAWCHLLSEIDLASECVLELEEYAGQIQQEPTGLLKLCVLPQQVAYLIYTSGSTGRPKGVMINHANASNLVQWARTAFLPEDLRVVAATTSICFDLSLFEFFVPLSRGGQVLLLEDALQVVQVAARTPPTLLNTVPSAIQELVQAQGLPAEVRVVNLAGEALSPEVLERVYARGVGQVVNLYGPSETTTYSTAAWLERGEQVSIGQPIANTQVYVLDTCLQPLPVGVPGELYIGGSGVARGYLRRPALTAERFVPDPFGKQSGGRLYRTGDIVRWKSNGLVEYLGRSDYQVKLRGYRVELGEIEAVLREQPEICDCIVVAQGDAPEDRRLIAYLVFAPSRSLNIADIRRIVRDRLPAYMVPSIFISLDALPLTPNGKVNRRALPVPQEERPDLYEAYVAPRTVIEETLAELLAQVLQLQRVGIYDNFFELGGHSLLATQFFLQVQEIFQIDLPLRYFFQGPTVAELAELVMQSAFEQADNDVLKRILAEIEEPESEIEKIDEASR